jgi:hypothetical protein
MITDGYPRRDGPGATLSWIEVGESHAEIRPVPAAFRCVRRARLYDRSSAGLQLVCLRDSKDVRLSYDPDRLQVNSVGLEDVERVALEYINYRYGKQKSQERDDQLLRLRTALVATARPEGLARGYKVTAKGIGVPELNATRGNIGVKLAVGLLPRKDFKIAFKFLRQLDSSGKVINATKWTPDDAPWMLTRLNWTFGAQANIFFTSVEAAWFTVQKALGPKIMRDVFRTDIVPHKTRGADITCFLVGDYDATAPRRPASICQTSRYAWLSTRAIHPCSTMAKRSLASWRTRSVTSCTTNGTSAEVDTIIEAVFCFPAVWKACPWTKTSSPTSPRGESACSRHPFGTVNGGSSLMPKRLLKRLSPR